MKNRSAITAKHSSPQASADLGVGTALCAFVLFVSIAALATPVTYGSDAKTQGITPDETPGDAQQHHNDSMPTSPATYSGLNEKTEQQPTRLLDSAIEARPGLTLDLGLCDGS